jgi:pimeloyl-ACP methyl ester carboxylesterase
MFGSAAEVERYIADLSRPGALTAALNWYRANVAPQHELRAGPPLLSVAAPKLGIWSSGDRYFLEERMLASAAHVTSTFRYERVEGAGHWMQLDAPERLNALLVEFLTSA